MQRFRELEDQLWAERVSRRPQACDVATSWGTTRLYRWPGVSAPVVLLHGMGGTSVMWALLRPALAPRDVVAVDTMGDVGRSVPTRPFASPDDVAGWLDEVLRAAGLGRVHLVGTSYGAWVAIKTAGLYPAAVKSLSLIEPVGITPLSKMFWLWGAAVFAAAALPRRDRRVAGRWLCMPVIEDRRAIRMTLTGQINHPFRLPFDTLADDELRRIAVPTLVMLGARTAIGEPGDIAHRFRRLVPQAEVTIIPKAGHGLALDARAHLQKQLASFIDGTEVDAGESAQCSREETA